MPSSIASAHLSVASQAASQRFAVVFGAAIFIFLTCGFGRNLDLALLSVAIFAASCLLLWRPGESPVLAITFCVPWLGASIAIFYANWLGVDLFAFSEFGGDMRLAAALSLVGLFCAALGMRLGAGAWRPREAVSSRRIALARPVFYWFQLYCGACMLSFVAGALSNQIPALAQVFLAVIALRWAFFGVLAYASFARGKQAGPYLPIAFFGEFLISIGGFFSDFKTVFLFMICAAFASGARFSGRRLATLAILAVSLISLFVVWTGVKKEYRQFVSEGQHEQVVAVDYATRMSKLYQLVTAMDGRTIDDGVDNLLRRLSYIDFFSVTLDFVPRQVAHEHGALLADALTRPFMPRAFFPDKAIIDDTERTNFYTGGLAGTVDATSISVGYVAEMYIDFGMYGMMAAMFGIGCAYGFIYRMLTRSEAAGSLLGMGLASAALMSVGDLANSLTKVVGGIVAFLLVTFLFIKLAMPMLERLVAFPRDAR